MNSYEPGDDVVLYGQWTNNGAPVEPSEITVRIIRPDGTRDVDRTKSGGDVTTDGNGAWSVIVRANMSGIWRVSTVASGTAQGVTEHVFNVSPSRFPVPG